MILSLALLLATLTLVHFPSLQPGVHVDLRGYLSQPSSQARHPAVVFLHGCSGLLDSKGQPKSREREWARVLDQQGYVVLMVDSFTPRGIRNMCSATNFNASIYLARPYDAYAALAYLQQQPFVDPARIALMGWSEGGGTVLFSVGGAPHRPSTFAAAVAFYPASCSVRRLGAQWTSSVPLLILIGDGDVWTPLGPCTEAMRAAMQAQPAVTLHTYAGAYHDFDWPNDPVHRLPAYRTANGVVPIAGEDPEARKDALQRVSAFLKEHLGR